MPYASKERLKLAIRAAHRKERHGNWRQTYIDCAGMCVAQVDGYPCGGTEQLELHEEWGENHSKEHGKFQNRFLICNYHHSMIDDRVHSTSLIEKQFHVSQLQDDVQIEVLLCGGYYKWIKNYGLDNSRFGCLLFQGPIVKEDYYETVCTGV